MTKENQLFIVDTKKGDTAKSIETKDKAEALQRWIKENRKNYDFEIIGGIVKQEYPNWQINQSTLYVYSSDWKNLEF